MKYLQIRSLILVLGLALLGVACDSGSTTGPGENQEQTTVNGKVEDDGSQSKAKTSSSGNSTLAAVEGATVTAARVTADGSMETISGAEAETNAEGEFSLNINAEAVANTSQNIVVMAEKNGQQWKAYVASELESGSSATVQPLTVESSGEADVYTELVADGNAEMVSEADIEAYVGAETSSEIRSNSQAAATVAEALAAEAEARADFYANQSAEVTEEQKQQIMEAKTEAQIQLASDLDAATSTEDRQAAMKAFTEAMVQAHLDADVSAEMYAKAKKMSADVYIKHTSDVSAEASSEARAHAALITSYAIDTAVQARMEAQGVAESNIQAAADAAVQLHSNINAMAQASKADIDAAFETYNEAVVSALSNEFSANADVIAQINTQINEDNGAKASLEASIEGTLDTGVLVDAYASFYSEVKTIVDESFSSATDAEAQMVADVMVLINLSN